MNWNETSTSQISDRQICEQQLIWVCIGKHPLQVLYTRQGAVVAKVEKGYDMKYLKELKWASKLTRTLEDDPPSAQAELFAQCPT